MAEQDDMVNNWGCNLVVLKGASRRNASLEVQRHGTFENLIKLSVPGFQFHSLHASGSAANATAIGMATQDDLTRCLIPMGSYVAGNNTMLQSLSTSTYAPQKLLSFVKLPSDDAVSDQCKRQTIPFPYHVPYLKHRELELEQLESQCLQSLERRLLAAALLGRRYRAMLLEPILSGNGGELSSRFLQNLGSLLKKYNVAVVCDEIMTGGRVGPHTMTMTPGMPGPLLECIRFITMGKIFGCGVVLEVLATGPTRLHTPSFRGTSTDIDPHEPYQLWRTIKERIDDGYILCRRREVLDLCNFSPDDKEAWGQGGLIFVALHRHEVKKNLKSRLLPKFEDVKLKKLATKPTQWNRITVTEVLKNATVEWLNESDRQLDIACDDPFFRALVEYLVVKALPQLVATHDLFNWLGVDTATSMAASLIEWKKQRTCYNYKKSPIRCIGTMLKTIELRNPTSVIVFQHGKCRQKKYKFNYGAALEM